MTVTTRERKFAAAEGLLNHIETHFQLHGQKLRMQAIYDIVRYSERIYEEAYKAGHAACDCGR